MILKTQILTLFYSFLYGIFFGSTLNINYKISQNTSKLYIIIIHFLFVIFHILTYFFILQKVNNGIFHPYGLITLIIGVLVEHLLYININHIIKFIKKSRQ